ncbi:MAG: glycosyltransferase family 39 protein [Chloroflexi bacterium]|nr:glycosyltransferase family 39 protein [Chloroflexota bacterium]
MKKFELKDLIKIIPLCGFLLILCLYYVTHKPFDVNFVLKVLNNFWDILISVTFVVLSGGIGCRLLKKYGKSRDQIFLSLALGLGILSLVFLLIGLGLGIARWWAWFLLGVLGIIFYKDIYIWTLNFINESVEIWRCSERLGKIIACLCIIILCSTMFIALAPPVKFDALVYHLALPSNFIETRNLGYIPENMFWGMPQIGEMLFTWVMLLADVKAAACLGWLIGLMTLGGLLQYMSRRFNSNTGWIVLAVLLSGYTFSASLSWAYVDWFTMLFGLGVIFALDRWVETNDKSELLYMGALAGFCLGTKYTAGVIIVAAFVVIFWQIFTYNYKKCHKPIKQIISAVMLSWSLFGVSLFIMTLPWWIRNFYSTGNPFYPLLFPAGAMDGYRLDFYQIPNTGSIWRTLLLPFSATFLGVEGATGYNTSIGPLLLGLAIFAWLPQNPWSNAQKRSANICLIIILTGLVTWMVAGKFSEYLIQSRVYFAIFPAIAVLSGIGFNGFSQINLFKIRFRNVVASLVFLSLGFSVFEISRDMMKMGALEVFLNIKSEEEYLADNLGWYYPAINKTIENKDKHKVLMLFEPRSYFCTPFCDPDEIIDRWKHDLYLYENENDILQSWIAQGYTDILYNRFGAEYIRENDGRYLPSDWQKLEDLLSHLPVIENFGGDYYLYSLKP